MVARFWSGWGRGRGAWENLPMDGDADADIAAFRAEGYVKLGQLLPEATLRQLQASFRREQEIWRSVHANAQREALAAEQEGDHGWRSSGYFDVPRILETDDAYLELLEQPRLVALLRRAVSERRAWLEVGLVALPQLSMVLRARRRSEKTSWWSTCRGARCCRSPTTPSATGTAAAPTPDGVSAPTACLPTRAEPARS